MTTDFKKALVEAILRKPDSYKWTIQGLGMLRMNLSPTIRLHVWSEKYKVPNVSDIHTHPWNLTSTVIAGRIQDTTFWQGLGNVEETKEYLYAKIQCGPGGGMVGQKNTIRLSEKNTRSVVEGQAYYLHSSTIHQSKPEDGTVTIIEKVYQPDGDHAYVYWPAGTEWVSAEPKVASPDIVREITRNSLEKYFS